MGMKMTYGERLHQALYGALLRRKGRCGCKTTGRVIRRTLKERGIPPEHYENVDTTPCCSKCCQCHYDKIREEIRSYIPNTENGCTKYRRRC